MRTVHTCLIVAAVAGVSIAAPLLLRDADASAPKPEPPPAVVASTSNRSPVSVTTRGWRITSRSVSVGKLASIGRWLMVMVPEPGLRNTRAVDVLRRPVP